MPYIGNIVQDFSVNNAMLNTDSVTSIKIDDGTIVNADINDSAAIAGTKINPDFGSQNTTTTGIAAVGELQVTSTAPKLLFIDSDTNPDFELRNMNGVFRLRDSTNDIIRITQTGSITNIAGHVDIGAGLDVEGATTFNESGADVDFRIEGDTNANLFYVDAGNDRVGIGTNSPDFLFEVEKESSTSGDAYISLKNAHTGGGSDTFLQFTVAGTTQDNFINFGDSGSANSGVIHYNHESDFLNINVNGSEALRIDSSRRVLIGSTTADDAAQMLKVARTSGTARLAIQAANDGSSQLDFADVADADIGRIQYDHNSNYMGLFTNNSERMRIDSSGNVGIGTTSPGELLSLRNTSAQVNMSLQAATNGSCAIFFGDTDTVVRSQIKHHNNDDSLAFFSGGNNERMRIDSSGNVGIGTTSPGFKLEVVDSAALLKLNSSNEGNYDLRFVYQNSEANIWSYSSSDLTFGTRFAKKLHLVTNGPQKRVTIDDGGSVGIGTTSPSTILHVKANLGDMLRLDRDNAGAVGNQLAFRHKDGSGNFVETGSINCVSTANADASDLRFSTKTASGSNTERMRIDSSGNVGIGTTTPQRTLHQHISSSSANYHQFTNSTTGSGGGDGGIVGIDANEDLILWNQEGQNVRFGTSNTERMRVQTNGGISFNGDTAAANALDDYEEGTFTATAGNSVTLYSNENLCSYTKIGRQVTVRGQVRINSDNSNADFTINGLPFANVNDGEGSNAGAGAVRTWGINFGGGDTNGVIAFVSGTNSHIEFWRNINNGGAERVDAKSGGYVAFTVTYFTS